MPLANVHAEAERREHDLSPAALEAMEAALGYPLIDPHGDPIPSASGELARSEWQPLTAWPLGTLARIVHLEDEPAAIFSQIAAMGLRPGQIVQVIESNERRLVLSDGNLTHALAPIVAANIFVVADSTQPLAAVKRLSSLQLGQQATVYALVESLQGFTRRRLLDLGMTPGTLVTAEMPSMFRDPMAYRVRGTLIALRREQADQVLIKDQTK
jgi:DtxR family Mn-dependent transcriptional regulator